MKTQFKIGNLEFSKPIVQGGMGIGISLSQLAGNVSKNGGLGVLSGVEMGFNHPDYKKNRLLSNRQSLFDHLQRAKEICSNKPIGINIMTALTQYEETVKDAIAAKVDIIFAGAGLPLTLPDLTKNADIKISPIISSSRVAKLILKHWWRHYKKTPDVLVLEGPLAGGHLGFKKEELTPENLEKNSLVNLIPGILEEIKPYEDLIGAHIPLIAGGGIYDSSDVQRVLNAGADAVQIGTRFIGTHECDASLAFKNTIIQSKEEDIQIIESPAGLPGRAIINSFMKEVKEHKRQPKSCPIQCLKSCDFKTAPYCISKALVAGCNGDLENGFVFSGAMGYKVNEMLSVKALMNDLV